MLFLEALLVWFALSIPASLIVGRFLAAVTSVPTPSPQRRMAVSGARSFPRVLNSGF